MSKKLKRRSSMTRKKWEKRAEENRQGSKEWREKIRVEFNSELKMDVKICPPAACEGYGFGCAFALISASKMRGMRA